MTKYKFNEDIMIQSQVIGSGGYSPERVITNSFFENLVENADEWIFSRTGIRERRFAREDQATSDLATIAAETALRNAGISADDMVCIVLGTSPPDMCLPATACIVQKNIGANNAFAFDINSV